MAFSGANPIKSRFVPDRSYRRWSESIASGIRRVPRSSEDLERGITLWRPLAHYLHYANVRKDAVRINYEIPDELHHRAKALAALEGKTLREFVVEALRDAVSRLGNGALADQPGNAGE